MHHVQTLPSPPRNLNKEIHPGVEEVILCSLAKQPEHRQQKATQLAQDLIKAATTAVRIGSIGLPSTPIPKPDVLPEFGLIDSGLKEQAAQTSKTAAPSFAVSAQEVPDAPAKVEIALTLDEKEKSNIVLEGKAAKRKAGKKARIDGAGGGNAGSKGRIGPAAPVPECPTSAIAKPDTPFDHSTNGAASEAPTDSQSSRNGSSSLYLESQPEFGTKLPLTKELSGNEGAAHIADLSEIFKGAESLLDEILPDEQQSSSGHR